MRKLSGRASPAAISCRSSGSSDRNRSPCGPVQLTIRRADVVSVPALPRGRQVSEAPSPSASASTIRPAPNRSRPSVTSASIFAAIEGASRCRCTSQYGRTCRRNRARVPASAAPHISCVTGRSSSTAARQPIASARVRTWRTSADSVPAGFSRNPGCPGRSACARGDSPRRDSARISPRNPAASRVSAASIAVSPLPINTTRSVSVSSAAMSPAQGSDR